MAEQPREETSRSVGGDLVLPIAAVAFTIYYFMTIWDGPREAQIAAFLIGSILMFLVGVYLVRTFREVFTGKANLGFGPLIGPTWILPRRLTLLALTLGYLFGLDLLGFTLTSFLFLFAAMVTLSEARGDVRQFFHYGVVAASLSLAGWLLFIVAFDTRFPAGPFERLMEAMFGI